MNFVKCAPRVPGQSKTAALSHLFVLLLLFAFLGGCGDQVRLPSAEKLAEFETAGPSRPTVDMDRLVKAKIGGGPYRVVPGEVLELTMPAILQVVTAEEQAVSDKTAPFVCRVSETGTITLPVVGEIHAAGKTLAQIESGVIDAYHPKYTVTRPSVYAQVLEYKTAKVSVTGAVNKPGIYSLRSDQMSLVALLMEAGGIVEEGAVVIRIIHSPGAADSEQSLPHSALPDGVKRASGGNQHDAAVRSAGERTCPNDVEETVLRPRRVSSDKIKIRLAFRPLNPPDTKGVLTVGYDGRLLRIKNVDIKNELHRQTVAKYLNKTDQRFKSIGLEPELAALAQELEKGPAPDKAKGTLEKAAPAEEPRKDETERQDNYVSDEALYKQLVKALDSKESPRQQELSNRQKGSEPLVLPVRGLNIPFADVALADGDTVVVERLRIPLFTVVGLVNNPGNFPYPPESRYNLMQAIAFAGGLSLAAEPRYATVYRLKADGAIVRAPFEIAKAKNGAMLTDALSIPIKPGDIVAVEQTPRTRTNLFLERVFRITIGAYVPVTDIWESD